MKNSKVFKSLFFFGLLSFSLNNTTSAQNSSEEALSFASKQMIDLRIDHLISVSTAKKISNTLYELEVTGMGANGHKGLLYRPKTGNWVYLQRTASLNYDIFSFDSPALLFALEKTVLDTDESAPEEVREFLKPYFDLGKNLDLNRGINISGVWYPKQVEGTIGNLIKKMGLTKDHLLNNSKSGHSVQKEGGLLFRASYDHLALQKANIFSLKFDLGVAPSMAEMPGGMKVKEQELDLIVSCSNFTMNRLLSKTSSSPLTKIKATNTDCELKIQNEVRIDVNKEHLYFDTSIALRGMMNTNRTNLEKNTLPLDRNTDYAIVFEGDLRGGIWKNIWGIKGFDLQELKLQGIVSLEKGWSMGVFGALDFGDQTRISVAALLPVSPSQNGFGDVGFEGSISKISLEQIAMFPAAIGGPDTYPSAWKKEIKESGIEHYGLQNVKLTIAPTITDPSLGIDETGTTFTGTLILADQAISSLKINVSEKGIYFDEAIEPFKIGWFELKNARFKGFIPSKKTHDNPEAKKEDGPATPPNRNVKYYVNQNRGILYFDTIIELDGNTERAYVSLNPINAGIGFEANITKDIGAGFLLRLDIAKLTDGSAPFDVMGYIHVEEKLANIINKMVSTGLDNQFKTLDKTYQKELNHIKWAEHRLDSLKGEYNANRKKAQEAYDKAVAPLKHAEHVLNGKKHELEHLKDEANHWKHKAHHYHWYEVGKISHAYYEEGKYWAEHSAYKAVVEAAELVVKSLEETTHFVSVDADPLVVASFAEYNGSRFTLAIAKGALTAAKKADSYVSGIADQVLNGAFKSFSIEKIGISGLATAPGEFGLNLNLSGSIFGKDWNVSPPLKIAVSNKVNQITEDNLKAIEKVLDPMSSSIIVHAKSTYHGSDYAQYPPNAQLAYSWQRLTDGSDAVDIAAGKEFVFVNNTKGLLWFWKDDKWQQVPDVENVKRIAIASTMDYPVLVTHDGRLWQWNASTKKWDRDPQATSVSDVGVGPKGTIWITNTAGKIWRKETGKNWEIMPGSDVVRITVDDKDNAWVINTDTHIYHWKGNDWEKLQGEAVDIGSGNNQIWVIGMSDTIWHFIPGTEKWVRITGQGTNISVDPSGLPWIVSSSRQIWKNNGPK